ncbi:MAG TPA: metallophosphoesterase family protein [Rhodothermales bacterium]
MTLAFLSDVHANLPALEAVLADIYRRGPDVIYCLGDLVGYAPWPNEVVSLVRSGRIPTIAGNYDEGVGLGSDDCGCAYKSDEERARGAESIAFTNRAVSDETRNWLRGLPRHMRLTLATPRRADLPSLDVLAVHGSPRRINEYLFEDRPERSFVRLFEDAAADVLLFGHTHRPFHRVFSTEVDGRTRYRHAVNIGSVGKPKDGDPRACYVLLHVSEEPSPIVPDSIRPEFVRVEYDVDRAARAIEESALPDAFATALRQAL